MVDCGRCGRATVLGGHAFPGSAPLPLAAVERRSACRIRTCPPRLLWDESWLDGRSPGLPRRPPRSRRSGASDRVFVSSDSNGLSVPDQDRSFAVGRRTGARCVFRSLPGSVSVGSGRLADGCFSSDERLVADRRATGLRAVARARFQTERLGSHRMTPTFPAQA